MKAPIHWATLVKAIVDGNSVDRNRAVLYFCQQCWVTVDGSSVDRNGAMLYFCQQYWVTVDGSSVDRNRAVLSIFVNNVVQCMGLHTKQRDIS